MAALALRVLAAALLEGDDLRPALLLDDLARDGDALDCGQPDLGCPVAREHEHVVEGDGLARPGFELGDRDDVLGGDAVLLAAGLDHCEHRFVLVFEIRLSAQARGRLLGSFPASGTRPARPQTQARGREPAREAGEISAEPARVNIARHPTMLPDKPYDVVEFPRRCCGT